MRLIDSYVNEIARRLPRKQRDDVREELRSALRDALDSRIEGEASEDDVVTLLREFGRPEQVAASYRPESQFLIGPVLYPSFKTVTGVVLTVLVSLVVVGFVLDLVVDPPQAGRVVVRILGLLGEVWETALSTFAVIVLIFAVLQRFSDGEAPDESWDPRKLPQAQDLDLVGRGEATVGIIIPAVFLVLFNLLKGHFGVRVNPDEKMLLNDVFQDHLLWLNLALVLGIALNAWLFRSGHWQWPTRLFNWGIDVYWIWILFSIAGAVAAREAILIDAGVSARLAGLLISLTALIAWIIVVVIVWGAARVLYRSFASGRSAL
jgi:MFS family permease